MAQSSAYIFFSRCSGLCTGNHIKFKYQSGGSCCPSSGMCSDGLACPLY
ncbi:MAG TPA: hypothetical protein VF815_25410 [Myxococcaceae bacterium]